jgi:hypothetical protein
MYRREMAELGAAVIIVAIISIARATRQASVAAKTSGNVGVSVRHVCEMH